MLLGPYSRFYWHHPGPVYFYVLNVIGNLFGGQTVGVVLAAVCINVVAAAGILLLTLRRGGRWLMTWAALLLTAYLVAIEPIPFDIWNPSATLLPFALVLLLAWSVASRDWWMAPWLVLVGSFAVQTHVGLAPGVAMAFAFAAVVGVWRQRRRGAALTPDERRSVRRVVLVSGAVGFLVWLPPLIEQLTSREGNLTLLYQFFSKPGSPHPIGQGLQHTALQATLMLRSVFEPVSLLDDAHQGLAVALVMSAVALVGAVLVARKVRATDVVVLMGLVVIQLGVGVYAVTRIAGPIQFYLVQWISAVGFVLWVGVGNAGLALARDRLPSVSWGRTAARSAAVVLVVLVCVGAIRAFPGDAGHINENLDVPNNRALFGYVPVASLLRETRPGQTVVLRLDSLTAWEVLAADALLLQQHGRHVQVVSSPVTRLLIDDSLLVHGASGAKILAFRDRPHPHLRPGERVVAAQGEWTIVEPDRR